MKEIIAYCGIVCTECPAYVATQNEAPQELERVAAEWSKEFEVELKPEDVICDGCPPGHTRYCSHCAECEIRACATAKALRNCAYCDEYSCGKLTDLFKSIPSAKRKLDEIRAGL